MLNVNEDSASQIVETIWPLSAAAHRSDAATGCKGVLPLRTFIQETLRRSRTSYSTLQVALYYLIKIKSHVPNPDASPDQNGGKPVCRAMQCGRRMFLAALILASKYLQDRNYSARAWSKISGLNTAEINQNELMFLGAVSWRLHIPEALFQRWTDIVLKLTQGGLSVGGLTWQSAIPRLTPELEGELEAAPASGPLTPNSMRSYDARFSESPSPRGSSTRGGGPCSAPLAAEPCTLPSIHDTLGLYRRTSPVGLPSMSRLDGSQAPPSLPRPPMLPTPQLTPQSILAGTPAVSAGGVPSHRRHICSAMSQAHHAGLARSTIDQRPPPSMCPRASTFDGYSTVRRSSLARSSSSASSPDSMVSDVSTLSSSSRSSSVSSSSASGPGAVSLPRLATLRCTNNSLKDGRRPLSVVSPIDESVFSDFYNSPDLYGAPLSHAPDFSRFSLGTPVDLSSAHEAAQGLCELSGAVSRPTTGPSQRPCRKRGRAGSDDLPLPNYISGSREDAAGLPSGHVMNRFLNSKTLSAAQLQALNQTPLSGPVGMKRACCGSETQKIALHPSVRAEY
ncbi:putative G1/S-specific cyclin Pcl5 [Aspergillus candidus]|uniref:G1/S-specific cyclin Pcl5 n=1 Tax=Aspergillus candidus TaxID=41067 RepID=A0A2I2FD82_ASPCN|nr:hypothetical protein BDW47DRAFT_104541 [Aspergillus candidus]PLB38603.1 hypothetical protein BDW47DRAFT_104541 [Aspergillus candidus]